MGRWVAALGFLVIVFVTLPGCARTGAGPASPSTPASTEAAKHETEKEKIEALIVLVENLPDARFDRNGTVYDAKTAGKFLRGKWKTNAKAVHTAKDFIAKVATGSESSGKPYVIRFADGKEMNSGDYLTAELEKMEK